MDNEEITILKQTIHNLENQVALLEDERFQLKNLLNHIPGDLYWKNNEGVWLGVNQHCVNSLKRMGFIHQGLESEILGKNDFELFNQASAEIYRKNDVYVIKNEATLSREEVTQLPSGEQVTLLSNKSPMRDRRGQIIGIVGNTVDISSLKRIEAELKEAKEHAEAASRAKTEFLFNMRHDIRTPLSGIVGFSEIIHAESQEPKIKKYTQSLVASSHALLHLMDEVLEAVRINAGEIPLLKKKFDLVQLSNHLRDLYQPRAHEKNLKLIFNFDKRLPRYVIGDKTRLHRIALELLGNALNFTHSGSVQLSMELAREEQRNLVLRLKISDTGIGIAKEKQEDIYLQFKRLTPSYEGSYKGIGLGLYTVKQFIEELDGEIYVDSELEQGTEFTCLISLQKPLLDEPVEAIENEFIAKTNFLEKYQSSLEKGIQVLVVDDHPIAQSVAKSLLSALCCQVDVAYSGHEAIAKVQQKHYDLVFMDIGLGEGMDGYETTMHIRTLSKNKQRVPIVALTAHLIDAHRQPCIEAGIDAVLNKPLTQGHALHILQNFVLAHRASSVSHYCGANTFIMNENKLFSLTRFDLLNEEQGLHNCGSADILMNLLTLMANDELPADYQALQIAFSQRNFQEIGKIAHKIKGAAIYIGTTRLRYACEYFEQQQLHQDDHLLVQRYEQLLKTMNETLSHIKKRLKEPEWV